MTCVTLLPQFQGLSSTQKKLDHIDLHKWTIDVDFTKQSESDTCFKEISNLNLTFIYLPKCL